MTSKTGREATEAARQHALAEGRPADTAQGRTVDQAYLVAREGMTRGPLYVGMTRVRDTEPEAEPDA